MSQQTLLNKLQSLRNLSYIMALHAADVNAGVGDQKALTKAIADFLEKEREIMKLEADMRYYA